MAMLPDFLEPGVEAFEGGLAVDGEGQKNSCDSFIECSDNCFESLLAGLYDKTSTVSHICILTYFLSSKGTFFVAN